MTPLEIMVVNKQNIDKPSSTPLEKISNGVEQVLVIPRNKVFNGKPIPNGFGKNDLTELINRIYQHAYFIDRPKAENNSSLKQIIPYIMVTYHNKIFSLHRKATQTEKRLHDKYSIGVGGHINPVEQSHDKIDGIIEKGLERELNEELLVQCSYNYKVIGYINDDTNDVGSVHFGLVHRLTVTDGKAVSVAEKDMMEGQFMSMTEIEKIYPLMETWSQLLFDAVKTQL